ncbi:siroheme synthase [hot springs metagenome]|uniref:precorrin-2 dehydrogenase n=1 Tax=hot springs metagenome TaxID=433727 RepID=A0A5J4KTW2_9ZZZZ
MTTYYPAFINLIGKKCVVVGGGKIAERKVLSLLNAGANVTVISPDLSSALERYKNRGKIKHIKRGYKKGDIKNAFLVIAATSDEAINSMVSKDAPFLVNVVDRPELANFIVPSVVNRGPMTIAVSTSGASPAMAKAVRKELEVFYNKDFGQYMSFLKQLRERAIKEIPNKKERERFLKDVASREIFNILREKGIIAAKKRVVEKFRLLKKGLC